MGRRRQSQTRKKVKRMVPQGQAHILQLSIIPLSPSPIWVATRFPGPAPVTPASRVRVRARRMQLDWPPKRATRFCPRKRDAGDLNVIVKGPGPGREQAIRSLQASGIRVKSIRDITPVPHNGCRPRKRRV